MQTPATKAGVLEMELQPKAGPALPATAPASSGDSMLAMMERLASNKDVDVVKLQALIDMQKDIMQVNARAAFNAAFARLQAKIPTVIEKGKGDKGMSYARLEDIIETVRPVLQRHGFSLSHQTEWPDKTTIKVIGVLTHEQGHERRSEFVASADQTGSKNAIQALGSSNSYGRRYTTKDLLNIVTKEEDDDGRKADQKPINEPTGYEQWYDDMDAMVTGGCTWKEFAAAWNPEGVAKFREHLAKVNPGKIDQWKKKAKAVKDA